MRAVEPKGKTAKETEESEGLVENRMGNKQRAKKYRTLGCRRRRVNLEKVGLGDGNDGVNGRGRKRERDETLQGEHERRVGRGALRSGQRASRGWWKTGPSR